MKTIKLVVTHHGQLSKKYDAKGLKAISKAISSLIAKDLARGITTQLVHLDKKAEMKKYKAAPVTGKVTPQKCKKAIDALFKALSPDYLVLLGSDDVIPYFNVTNPSYDPTGEGDDDAKVPTDNPYANSQRFVAANRKSYLVPDRVVGRIPDLPGSNDPAWLLDYLKVAESWKLGVSNDFKDDFFVCCDAWKNSGQSCMTYLSRKAGRLLISPPTSPTIPRTILKRYGTRLHMIKCHGAPLDPSFYGQKGQEFPEVLFSKALEKNTVQGTVVGAMCCYGASVFDPQDPRARLKGAPPIPSVYLRQGAYGFFGSTTIAWVGFDDMQCADWIVAAALKNVLQGASLGRAMLEAKQNLVNWINQQGRNPDIMEEKTLLQFHLLGDPSIHIVPSAQPSAVPAAMPRALRRGRMTAAMRSSHALIASGMGSADERRARREAAHVNGGRLRDCLPERKAVNHKSANATLALEGIINNKKLKLAGFKFDVDKPLVQEVQRRINQPELRPAMMRGVAAAGRRVSGAVAPKESFEYYYSARKKADNVIDARMVKVETDKQGNVIRTQVLVSS